MKNIDPEIPLFVDLDGTLIKSDITFESIVCLLKTNIFYLALLAVWALRGLPYVKTQLSQRVQPELSRLPVNEEFMTYLKQQKQAGRELTLISASHQSLVERIGKQVGLFDRLEGTRGNVNLKGSRKLDRIRVLCPDSEFGYAGNAHADVPIWKAARQAILVNCSDQFRRQLDPKQQSILQFDRVDSWIPGLVSAMRIHQWLKNGLIFLPLILSHQVAEPDLLLRSIVAFLSFSLCASSVYLANDLLDLDNDRRHESKRERPFAAGSLPLQYGFLAIPALLLSAFLIALLLPPAFFLVLLLYWLLTSSYNLFLKRLFLFDVGVLACLYTLRIFAGSAAISVVTTSWLIAFSLCLFLGLAMVKRVTELTNLINADAAENAAGRGYHTDHRQLLMGVGFTASLAAVVVFGFYINASATLELYRNPQVLWLICPLLMAFLLRLWRRAHTGDLDEDPVLFAVTDKLSLATVLASGALIWLAT